MTVTRRREQIASKDGDTFDGALFLPDAPGPGVVLYQEIWGVGEFVEAKAAALAARGYVVLCPDVFWRVERNVVLAHDDAGLAEAFGYMGRFSEIPAEATEGDLVAGLEHLRALPEVTGKVAALGYCLGGRLAFELAAAGAPDACVAYYGSGISNELGLAEKITCPVLLHFGGADPYIAREDVARVEAVFSGRPGCAVAVQERAGHAFENSFAPAFYDEEAAAASWPVTLAFLDRTLGMEH